VNRESPIGLLATHLVRTGVDTLEEVPASRSRRMRNEAPEPVQVGSVVAGRYQLAKFVAEGAFGAVYRAHDLDVPGHVVALKLMHRPPASPSEEALCRREVQLIAAVSHPSVVSFKHHGFHQGRFYIVMPWYEGETLADRLRGEAALTRREALRIFQQLAQALAAMHARGIRHQDVKPENILLARFGEGQEDFPVLLDLGVGAFSHEQVPGFTPAYVAPEMARAHLEMMRGESHVQVDGKADVFALALTLFDALAPGARDLSDCNGSPVSLLARAQDGVVLPKRKELADIEPALSRFMAVDPAERPAASELVQELSVLTRAEDRRAERKRMALRAGPFFSAALAMSLLLGVKLHDERAEAKARDLRIEAQAQELESSREALGQLDAQRKSQLLAYSEAQSENTSLSSQIAAEHQKQVALRERLSKEQRAITDQKSALDAQTARALQLGDELDAQKAQVQKLEQERAALQASVQKLTSTREELSASLDSLRKDKAELDRSFAQLSAQNERLTSERDRLQKERETQVQREAKLERQLAQQDTEEAHLNQRVAELEREQRALANRRNTVGGDANSERRLVLDRLRQRPDRKTLSANKPMPVM
jgi:serine/threonine protein kinase